jgi:hypothetical protein
VKRMIVMALGVVFNVSAIAGDYTSALGSCLADNTTGKDRRDLARWIYVAMSEHPEMGRLSKIPAEAKEEAFKTTGSLVTRLLSENCASQAREAIKHEGPASFQGAFEVLGRLAMQELMTNGDVNAAVSSLGRYADQKKLDAALREQ